MGLRPFPFFASTCGLRYALAFEDDFEGTVLNEARWLPHYLPHWSSLGRSRARYTVADGCLILPVDPDQEPWCPEFDGATRVSNVQTGHQSGPLGSAEGQHRFKPGLVVREAVAPARHCLPHHGAIECALAPTLCFGVQS